MQITNDIELKLSRSVSCESGSPGPLGLDSRSDVSWELDRDQQLH